MVVVGGIVVEEGIASVGLVADADDSTGVVEQAANTRATTNNGRNSPRKTGLMWFRIEATAGSWCATETTGSHRCVEDH